MEKQVFKLTELEIQKMPGLPNGLASYENLSPQINIIAGPNASGKSSTARAIQRIIWQNETRGIRLSADTKIDNDQWKVRIDSTDVLVQREGKEDELTGIPAAEAQSRYMLALHKLIEADEGDLAQRIIQESIGGYDLEEAASNLNYSDHVKTKGTSEYKSFKQAQDEVKEKTQEQKRIKGRQGKLSDLYDDKEKGEKAEKRKELYKRITEYLKARQDFEKVKAEFEEYPESLEKANGEELDRVKELEGEVEEAENKIREAKNSKEQFENELEGLRIPEDGVVSEELTTLEKRIDQIKKLEDKLIDTNGNLEEAREVKKEALEKLSDDVDDEHLEKIELNDIEHIDQFLQEAHQVASRQNFLEVEINQLEKEQEEFKDKSLLQKGIDTLAQWLKEPVSSESSFPSWIPQVIIALTILGGIGLLYSWIVGLVAIIGILLLALFGLFKTKGGEENKSARIRKQDFENLELRSPESWDADAVQRRLADLVSELQDASWQERIEQEIAKRKDQLQALEGKVGNVKETANNLKESLSALPQLPFDDPENYTALYWFIINLKDWQKANSHINALEKSKNQYETNIKDEIEKCNQTFNKYNFSSVEDSAEASGNFRSLRDEEQSRREAVTEIDNQESIIEEKKELVDRKTAKIKELYDKLDIPTGEKGELQRLLNNKDDYEEVKDSFNITRSHLADSEQEMKSHSSYENEDVNIEDINVDQAEDILESLQSEADKLDEIKSQITEIETEVKSVKKGDNLELALKRRDEALDNLYEMYESNVSSLAGRFLVDQLRNKIKTENRPQVFQRAKELFNRITKGKYEIDIDDRDQAEFIAYDTEENIGKKLHQLSTGTRIQLLLSIRVAFVETQETNIKLPILADELLANSDDRRAKAIIEALTEISKEGRQIFYFTAQADEVNKWVSYLSEHQDIDYEVFNIQERVYPDTFKDVGGEEFESFSLLEDVPAPNGESYEDYGSKVDVTEYDLLTDQPSQLHLWYLLDDKDVLYRCLSKGIEKWGRLNSYIDHSGYIEGLSEEKISKLEEKVRLLEHFQKLYGQGRPKPIDRTIIESSDAVSETFIDEVAEKLKELNGNPVYLLEALRNSEVSGFRNNKIEELENYLLEAGYIDEHKALDLEEIKSRIHAYISNSDLTLEHANSFLERVISDKVT